MSEREIAAREFVLRVVRGIFRQDISEEQLRETVAKVLKATYVPKP